MLEGKVLTGMGNLGKILDKKRNVKRLGRCYEEGRTQHPKYHCRKKVFYHRKINLPAVCVCVRAGPSGFSLWVCSVGQAVLYLLSTIHKHVMTMCWPSAGAVCGGHFPTTDSHQILRKIKSLSGHLRQPNVFRCTPDTSCPSYQVAHVSKELAFCCARTS